MLGALYTTDNPVTFQAYTDQIRWDWGRSGVTFPGLNVYIEEPKRNLGLMFPGDSTPTTVLYGMSERFELFTPQAFGLAVAEMSEQFTLENAGVVDNKQGMFAIFRVQDFAINVNGVADPHKMYMYLRYSFTKTAQSVTAVFDGWRAGCTNYWRALNQLPALSVRGQDKASQIDNITTIAEHAPLVIAKEAAALAELTKLSVPHEVMGKIIERTFRKGKKGATILGELAENFSRGVTQQISRYTEDGDDKARLAADLLAKLTANYSTELGVGSDETQSNAYALFQAVTHAATHGLGDGSNTRTGTAIALRGTDEQREVKRAMAESNHDLVDNFFSILQEEALIAVN